MASSSSQRFSWLAIVALAAVWVACSEDSPLENLSPVATLTISPDSVAIVEGEVTLMTAELRDASGNILVNRAVWWTSQNRDVAEASASGLVRGIAPGVATITATSEGVSEQATVAVSAMPVASVVLSPDSLTIVVGDTAIIDVTLLSASGDTLRGRAVSWASLDTLIAVVDSAGRVVGQAAGLTGITALSEGIADTAQVRVDSLAPVSR